MLLFDVFTKIRLKDQANYNLKLFHLLFSKLIPVHEKEQREINSMTAILFLESYSQLTLRQIYLNIDR